MAMTATVATAELVVVVFPFMLCFFFYIVYKRKMT